MSDDVQYLGNYMPSSYDPDVQFLGTWQPAQTAVKANDEIGVQKNAEEKTKKKTPGKRKVVKKDEVITYPPVNVAPKKEETVHKINYPLFNLSVNLEVETSGEDNKENIIPDRQDEFAHLRTPTKRSIVETPQRPGKKLKRSIRNERPGIPLSEYSRLDYKSYNG